jgi:myo-inositol-1(or 4)-monophosphatase
VLIGTGRAQALGNIVRQAGAVAQNSRLRLQPELKADGSIVTNGDRDVELWLRAELGSFAPGTTVWGEEFGHEPAGPEGLWLIDPIDGTSNYTYGSPLWGVSVALAKDGRILIGAVFLPDLNELYIAEAGEGAYLNDKRLAPIPHGPIKDHELVSYSDWLLRNHTNFSPPGKMRLSGAFVIDGTYTATQRFRGLVGERERLYDVAACVLIGLECDADVRYANGDPFDVEKLCEPKQINQPWVVFPRGSEYFYQEGAK